MEKRKNDTIQSRSTGTRFIAVLLIVTGVLSLLWMTGAFSTDVFVSVGEAAGQFGENVGQAAGSFGENIGEFFGNFGESIGNFFGNFGEGIGNFFGNFGENIVNLLPFLLVGVGLFLLLYRPRPQLEVLDRDMDEMVDSSLNDVDYVTDFNLVQHEGKRR